MARKTSIMIDDELLHSRYTAKKKKQQQRAVVVILRKREVQLHIDKIFKFTFDHENTISNNMFLFHSFTALFLLICLPSKILPFICK